MDSIVEGVTIGVVVAGILGLRQWFSHCRSRNEQMAYIKDIIARGHASLRDAKPVKHLDIPVHVVRATVFEGLLREASAALDHRADNIAYGQQYELRTLIMHSSLLFNKVTDKQRSLTLTMYESVFFSHIRQIEWLAEASPEPLRDPDDDHTRDTSG